MRHDGPAEFYLAFSTSHPWPAEGHRLCGLHLTSFQASPDWDWAGRCLQIPKTAPSGLSFQAGRAWRRAGSEALGLGCQAWEEGGRV